MADLGPMDRGQRGWDKLNSQDDACIVSETIQAGKASKRKSIVYTDHNIDIAVFNPKYSS